MIQLGYDFLVATFKTLERLTRPQACSDPTSAGVVEHRPPAAPPSASAGGHPDEPTSQLLSAAAGELLNLAAMVYSRPQPWAEGMAAELRDRAAQFAAIGD